MEDEDYQALIALLEEELRGIDASDIADERHYAETDTETGEARLLGPKQRLIEMLFAFERFLAIQDREVYNSALASINEHVRGARLEAAIVVPLEDTAIEHRSINLGSAPELGPLRRELKGLIDQLREGGSTSSEPR